MEIISCELGIRTPTSKFLQNLWFRPLGYLETICLQKAMGAAVFQAGISQPFNEDKVDFQHQTLMISLGLQANLDTKK